MIWSVFFVYLIHLSYAANCPSGLPKDSNITQHGDKCYEFVIHHRVDWIHAQTDCQKKGGNLVTIQSMAEQTFIQSSLHTLHFSGKGVWIGLHDRVTDGHYEWASGESVTKGSFTYWAPGQPGGFLAINEDCVLLKFHESGHWHDYHCADRFLSFPEHDGWICEYYGSAVPHGNANVTTTGPVVNTQTTSSATSIPTTMMASAATTTASPESPSPTMTPSSMAAATATRGTPRIPSTPTK